MDRPHYILFKIVKEKKRKSLRKRKKLLKSDTRHMIIIFNQILFFYERRLKIIEDEINAKAKSEIRSDLQFITEINEGNLESQRKNNI